MFPSAVRFLFSMSSIRTRVRMSAGEQAEKHLGYLFQAEPLERRMLLSGSFTLSQLYGTWKGTYTPEQNPPPIIITSSGTSDYSPPPGYFNSEADSITFVPSTQFAFGVEIGQQGLPPGTIATYPQYQTGASINGNTLTWSFNAYESAQKNLQLSTITVNATVSEDGNGNLTLSGENEEDAVLNALPSNDSGNVIIFYSTFSLQPANPSDATELSFTSTPPTTVAGTAISPSVSVQVLDSDGNLVTGDTSSVTLSVSDGPIQGTLGGTLTEPVENGVATFSDLTLSEGGGYTLEAEDGSLPPATSQSFTVVPTLLSLARLSADVYSSTPAGDGGSFTYDSGLSSAGGLDEDNAGYAANAYEQLDSEVIGVPSEIVIAIRGTVFSPVFHPYETLKNIASDLSFGNDTPDSTLVSEVDDAAAFVSGVATSNPGVPIVLTGHSLGGAVAQLIGEATGLPTVTFNAPGAAQLYEPLFGDSDLSSLAASGPGDLNINYRVWGDQISLFGTPIGRTFTLAPPAGTSFASASAPAYFFLLNASTFLNLHAIDTVIQLIAAGGASQPSAGGDPNVAQYLEDFIQPSSSSIPSLGSIIDYFTVAVTSGASWLLDPAGGSDFVLSEQAGSPDFSSILLPYVPGVSSFNVRYQTAAGWSSYQTPASDTVDSFGAGVIGVEFQPIGPDNQPVTVPGSFFFGAAFDSDGTYNGTIDESGVIEAPTGTYESTITLTGSSSSATQGDSITFTATVKSPFSPGEAPTGTVDFLDTDGNLLGTGALGADGTATFSTAYLPVGADDVIALYNGDDVYSDSISSPLAESIAAPPPSRIALTFGRITLPSEVLPGGKWKASVPVTLEDSGAELAGTYTLALYLDTGDTLDGNQIPLANLSKKFSFKPDGRATFHFNLKSPPSSLAAGTYHLLAEVIDPTGLRNTLASTQTVHVDAPSVSLAVSAGAVSPTTLEAGRTGSVFVTILDNGNSEATGTLSLTLSPADDSGSPLNGVNLATLSKRVAIKPGKSLRLELKFKLTSALPAGSYAPYVTASLDGTFASILESSKFAVN